MRLASLQRLVDGLRLAPHDYKPSLQVFPDISIAALDRDLRVAERGHENGALNLPAPTSETYDETEYAIIEQIFSERKAAHAVFVDQIETYAQRLSALDFHGRFTLIRNTAPEALAEFNAEALQGRDQLYQLRRTLVENERERDAFRRFNGLEHRAPRVPSSISLALKITLLAFLFVSETYVNAAFLAKGAELGFLGGVVEALTFAILNVLFSFGIGLGGVRQINRPGLFRKFIGFGAIVIWLSFAIALNLALAHYREAAGTLYEDAGAGVMARLYNAPAGLTDIKSWLFFAIGLIWSMIALIEGVLYYDPFPGYTALQKRVSAAHGDYIEHKNDLIANLGDIKGDAVQAMESAQRDLGRRRAEHAAILEGRSRVLQLFREQQDQLERAGNTLLAQYRSANRQARSEPVPQRFDRPWQMERLVAEAHLPEIMLRKSLDEEIRDSEELLTREIHAIHQAYGAAVETYHQIDDIIPRDQHGSAVEKQA